MKSITVRAVPFPKEQLPDVLKKHSVSVNAYALAYFAHPGFSVDHFPDEMHITVASLEELGFRQGASLKEISEVLPDYHLKPCPPGAGLFLRIAWKEQEQSSNSVLTGTHQAPDRAVTVFSEALEADDAFPKGLYLRKVDGKLWLRGYVCDDQYRWSGSDLFAFAEQESYMQRRNPVIALACDHHGIALKRELMKMLEEMGLEWKDFGTYSPDSLDDYPVYGYKAAKAVASGECDRGILLCGTGMGISIAAGKVKGIRVCTCSDVYSAEMSRRHNDSNILTMGALVVGTELAKMIARTWLTAAFEGGRHQRRIDMIERIENGRDPVM